MLPDSMNVGIIAENIKKLETMVQEAGSELPTPEAGDVGKILKVGSDGYELATEYSYTPPEYSTTETDTGKKWTDGRKVYSIAGSGTFPEITTSASTVDIITIGSGLEILSIIVTATDVYGLIQNVSNTIPTYRPPSGIIYLNNVLPKYSQCSYTYIVEYVKPAPVPSETKKKTSKKGEQNS